MLEHLEPMPGEFPTSTDALRETFEFLREFDVIFYALPKFYDPDSESPSDEALSWRVAVTDTRHIRMNPLQADAFALGIRKAYDEGGPLFAKVVAENFAAENTAEAA